MTENANTTAETTVEQPGLTVQDLNLVLQLIQVSSTRGAFKAEELTLIGGLYDRIFKFLEASGVITKAPVAPEASPAAETLTSN